MEKKSSLIRSDAYFPKWKPALSVSISDIDTISFLLKLSESQQEGNYRKVLSRNSTYPVGSRSNENLTGLGDVFAIHNVRYDVFCKVTAGNTFKKIARDI